jgi:A/G-specific adenine glycosylase
MYNLNDITYPLISWYKTNKRDLPWRKRFDHIDTPYKILVSEFMLQQTTVNAVIDHYNRFIKIWPNLIDFSEATEDQVLEIWSGLGYYSRGTNLLKTSKIIRKDFEGKIPCNIDTLKTFPGIGDYISSAVVSIAYNMPSRAVDTNIQRVITRYFSIEYQSSSKNKKDVQLIIEDLTLKDSPREIIQGLMDLGSLICKPREPFCEKCPINLGCLANKNKSFDYSQPKQKKKVPKRYGYVFLIRRSEGSYLITKRSSKGLLANTYQFPTNEWADEVCLDSLIKLSDKNISSYNEIANINHQFSHFKLELKVININSDNIEFLDKSITSKARWIPPEEFNKMGFSSLMKKIFPYLEY